MAKKTFNSLQDLKELITPEVASESSKKIKETSTINSVDKSKSSTRKTYYIDPYTKQLVCREYTI